MKVSKAISIAAAGGLLASMFAIQAPADAAVTTVATCNNLLAIGGAKSSIVGQGITDSDNRDGSVSGKGVDPSVNKGLNMGSCSFTAGLSTPDSDKPVVKGGIGSGSKSLKKWGTKLSSVEFDCDTTDTGDTTEWPLAGALSMEFNAITATTLKNQKLSGFIVVDGFTDPDNDPNTPSDVVEYHGLVIKGVAVGSDISGGSMFDPIFKDTSQTSGPTPGAYPYFGYSFDLAGAIGCTTPTQGDANIVAFVNGAYGGNSLLLGLPVPPITFTIGS